MGGTSLAELLASVEKKKYAALREKLGIPSDERFSKLELESLAYVLTERTGEVEVSIDGDVVRVGEPGSGSGIRFSGEAAEFLLARWSLARAAIAKPIVIELESGKRRS